MCEADSTTCTESDSTVHYDENDTNNDSLSSGSVFMEDTDDTENELLHIEAAQMECEGPVIPSSSSSSSSSHSHSPDQDASPIQSTSHKCKCTEHDKDKVFFSYFFLFLNTKLTNLFYS